MNDEEIKVMAEQHGFEGDSLELAIRFAREVERETRRNYFRLIQNAHGVLSAAQYWLEAHTAEAFTVRADVRKMVRRIEDALKFAEGDRTAMNYPD